MLEISILKIQDPGCFWGRIVNGVGIEMQSPEEYESLHVRMNLFYHDVNLDVQKIRPPSLTEHQVCVVYSPTLKSWCRAVVESVFMGTASCQVMCFLVDHAEHVLVSSDSVRAPLEKFLQLPFWVKKFQLAGICPMRLQVPVYQKKAKLVPSTYWDSSATRYLHSLVQASSLIEAVLCEVLEDTTAIELYLTIRNVKICVNDDLVTKKFACFSSTNSGSSPGDCGDDPIPVVLGCDLSKASDFVTQNGYVSKTLCFSISPRNELLNSSLEGSQVMGDSAEGAVLVLPQETPQAKPLSPETDTGTPTQRAVAGGDGGSASGASDCSEEFFAGAASDGSRADGSQQALETETLTSLADEFLDRLNLFRFMKFLNPFSKYKWKSLSLTRREKLRWRA
ncbi:hypothetical protein GJAV_G00229840 [Gymnothorax javanicus]|nr:hypothetical protein GJAV_G00229840 [Gymnothorax javanicus]